MYTINTTYIRKSSFTCMESRLFINLHSRIHSWHLNFSASFNSQCLGYAGAPAVTSLLAKVIRVGSPPFSSKKTSVFPDG